jgi:hypothetical protein
MTDKETATFTTGDIGPTHIFRPDDRGREMDMPAPPPSRWQRLLHWLRGTTPDDRMVTTIVSVVSDTQVTLDRGE